MLRLKTNGSARSGVRLTDRVIIADDNSELASAITYMIEGVGIEADATPDGLTTLQLCRRLRPRVLILDLYMPHMSGLEVLDAIREDPNLRDIYVIMLSGMAGDPRELASLAPLADRHLIKPVSADFLISAIEDGLEQGKTRGGLLGRLQRR